MSRPAEVVPTEANLAVIILAGGSGRRMGANKPLEKLGSRSMLGQVVTTALSISTDVVVVAGNPAQERSYRNEIPDHVALVHDKIQQKGPLIGLYTGLEKVNSEYAALLPCDSPFVKKEVLLFLHRMAKDGDGAVPVWSNGRIEPLHSIFRVESARRAAVEVLKAEMDTVREMIQQMDRIRFVSIDEIRELDPNLLTFFNVNTHEDLEKAKRILSETSHGEGASAISHRK
jgi:molybdopterin-guanine dinucleotide biosynthesis protein A